MPTWHYIILTEDIITHRPLTWQDYQTMARQHMLRPLAQEKQAEPQTTETQDSASSSLTAYTPLSSPPRPGAPTTATDTEPPHQTSVTTSPCLTDKRRSRTSDDRSIAQQQLKERQITTKRHTTRSIPAPTPEQNTCCNKACTLSAPPSFLDGWICIATWRTMHTSCKAPCRPNKLAIYCQSCSSTTGTPANQC